MNFGVFPLAGLLVYGIWICLAVGVPLLLVFLLWRFVRAYERRQNGNSEFIDRLTRLEERVARIDERLSSAG